MKKIVLVSLCVLFVASAPVFGYWVTGQVKEPNGVTVSGATVYINCYNANDGNSYSDQNTSGTNGFYSGGWRLKNCNGGTMSVKAVKGTKSGTLTWTAGNGTSLVDVNQDVTIRPPTIIISKELHLEAEPVAILDPDVTVNVNSRLFVQLLAATAFVNGGSATVQYDTATMSCSAEPCEPFNDYFYSYESPPGEIHVEAYAPAGMYVPVPNGVTPVPFFALRLKAEDFNTPGKISKLRVTSAEIAADSGMTGTFLSETEIVIGEPNNCTPYLRLDKEEDWTEALSSGHVYAMEGEDWGNYMSQWEECTEEGDPYPDNPFLPATLYVYGGGGSGGTDPCDAGLVMYWGDGNTSDGDYSSAWKFDYLKDPDFSNCIITVTVTAPGGAGWTPSINKVSFGLENPPDPGGPIRAWYWDCGAAGSGAPLTWGVPTTITIDTSKTGVNAATPTASAYMNNGGFSLKNVQWLIVDEDSNWVGGALQAPTPGTGWVGDWNYWHNLTISPKTTLAKGYYPKWSQPAVVIDANADPPIILGWDERSEYNDFSPHVVADDWECNDSRPVTDIHWWGSFIGWNQPHIEPHMLPQAFHIGIWTDDPCDFPGDFSHPGTLVWENYCDNYVWNYAGDDKDPRDENSIEPNDSCFQFNQLLSQDEWFYQEPNLADPCNPKPNIYWLSIAPVWGGTTPLYEWGWKTRPHHFNDDAVVITDVDFWPPVPGGTNWTGGYPIQWPPYPDPAGATWDVSFEITTNKPKGPSADLNGDGIVNFLDFAIFANQWLTSDP